MTRRDRARDEGAMLPLAMVAAIVLAAVTAALATYATAGLRLSRVVEDRADRLAAADGGMRYVIEKMRLRQTLCTTDIAQNGYTTVVPPALNGATIAVTCDRIGSLIGDTESWAMVATGQGVPAGQPYLVTSGGSGQTKSFGGPVFVSDPAGLGIGATTEIKDGDLWYTGASCPLPATNPVLPSRLSFNPAFLRGPLCTTRHWDELFKPPPLPPLPALTDPPPSYGGPTGACKVFRPGTYTAAPVIDAPSYFLSGDYYFAGVGTWTIGDTLVAGSSDGTNGDGQFLSEPDCAGVSAAFGDTRSGATFILGGSSAISIGNKGALEIMRRRQTWTIPASGSEPAKQQTAVVSVEAVATTAGGYTASTLTAGGTQNIFESKSGNNSDVAIHGLWWSPAARVVLGNVTNTANGQFLGGLVGAYIEVQASASVNALNIRVETSPATARWLLAATARKNGRTTTIRAVVQYQPDTAFLAINSWRVT